MKDLIQKELANAIENKINLEFMVQLLLNFNFLEIVSTRNIYFKKKKKMKHLLIK